MSANWGRFYRLSIFGESHGEAIGMLVDGLPPGIAIDEEAIAKDMARRAPGKDRAATKRLEPDRVKIVSGIYNNRTTGAPLCGIIENTNAHSQDYKNIQSVARPSHSDYTGYKRFLAANDIRGGGHFSGRITAPFVFAGALARQCLKRFFGIEVAAHILSIAQASEERFTKESLSVSKLEALREMKFPVLDDKQEAFMRAEVEKARMDEDSVGGVIECAALNVPAGWGSPFFDSIESNLAHLLFSVPATKGLEFGDGFEMSKWRGSFANDPLQFNEAGLVETLSNHNGGSNGGISNGMPIVFRAAIKPTASISKEQQSIDYRKNENASIRIKGRHDPCIVLRAVPVIESCLLIALMEAAIELHGQWGGVFS